MSCTAGSLALSSFERTRIKCYYSHKYTRGGRSTVVTYLTFEELTGRPHSGELHRLLMLPSSIGPHPEGCVVMGSKRRRWIGLTCTPWMGQLLHCHAEHALLHGWVRLPTVICPVWLCKAREMRRGLVRRIRAALIALAHGAALLLTVSKSTSEVSIARTVLPLLRPAASRIGLFIRHRRPHKVRPIPPARGTSHIAWWHSGHAPSCDQLDQTDHSGHNGPLRNCPSLHRSRRMTV